MAGATDPLRGPPTGTRIGPIDGVGVVGAGAAFPRDVDPACPELDTASALAALGAPADPRADGWGVVRRQWVALPGEAARVSIEDLAAKAGAAALADAGLDAVDIVHVATSTPSSISKSLAARVALRLGLGCLSADVRGGGAGAILAWIEAAALLRSGPRTALVVAADVMSPLLARGDPTGALYGDGAAAIVLGPGDGAVLGAFAGTTAVAGRAFTVPGALPPAAGQSYQFQRPDAAYREGLRKVRLDAARALRDADGPVDVALPYAATSDQAAELAEAIGAPGFSTLAETGCTGTAAVLVALAALRAKRRDRPLRLGAVAAGGGVVWAALAASIR
jgi:3-oxoacyl-[acyl-carrier-protein] synthase-3